MIMRETIQNEERQVGRKAVSESKKGGVKLLQWSKGCTWTRHTVAWGRVGLQDWQEPPLLGWAFQIQFFFGKKSVGNSNRQ